MESADSCANETRLEQDFRATEAFRTNSDDVSACERGSWVHTSFGVPFLEDVNVALYVAMETCVTIPDEEAKMSM